jgi:AbiU2
MTSEKKVRDIAADAFRHAIDIRFIIETLEAGNDPEAFQAVNGSRTAQVAECVYRALWTRLLIIVSRAYAKSRDGDLHVQHAFDLLKDGTTRAAVEAKGNAVLLAEAIALWSKCRGDHRLNSVLAFRDKQIAHWGELGQRAPIINDIFAVSRATATVFEKLAQGCGVVTLSLDSQLMGYPEAAARFWTR